jgi:hypothetical protein
MCCVPHFYLYFSDGGEHPIRVKYCDESPEIKRIRAECMRESEKFILHLRSRKKFALYDFNGNLDIYDNKDAKIKFDKESPFATLLKKF